MESTILDDIPDKKHVQVFLPLKDIEEKYRVLASYLNSAPPFFSLYFKPGTLPIESIDTRNLCYINIDQGVPAITLEAKINKIDNPQHLVMTLLRSINHEQVRESFRVAAVTNVVARPHHRQQLQANGNDWFFMGETIDLSGSGILASFLQKPPSEEQVMLELTLPNQHSQTINVVAHPVRTVKVSENQYDIAFHFDDVRKEDRDMIISCCLVLQRDLLRSKRKVEEL